MSARIRVSRRLTAGAAALLTATLLTGCNSGPFMTPWVVANHDEKVAYHANAGDELLNLDATGSLAQMQAFQSTGYLHIETEKNGSKHVEYATSVDGESYVSQRISDQPDEAFDQSHEAGSPHTYFLLGDKFKQNLAGGKSWVQVPVRDLDRTRTPEANCALYSVSYMCALVDAWNLTNESRENVPVQLSRTSAGDQHFATAVTYASLADAGLIPAGGQFDGFLSEESRAALIPLHLWVNPDGVVTKIEVNGVLTGDGGEELRLQIGFEITAGAASGSMRPVTDSEVPGDDVHRITTRKQFDEFIEKLNSM